MSESPLSILSVNADPLLLELIKDYLTRQGFIADGAESVHQAIQKSSDTHFDAIVSDYQIPEMDGIELLKEIRSRDPE